MRLIDADALRKAMYREAFENDSDEQKWESGCWIRYKMFERNIEDALTIDAVPVVRCKECKWFIDDHNEVDGWMTCTLLRQEVDKEWFCRDGERKNDENKMDKP